MQSVESYLSDELGDKASGVSDAVVDGRDVRPGFAISQGNGRTAIAASQTTRLQPSVSVLSIGANEGFAMRTPAGPNHECCGDARVAEYARRVRRAMLLYRRGGAARVLWLTLPAPKQAEAKPAFAAVNTAIVQAGQGLSDVRVVRLDLMFSPDGFRDFMRYRGQYVRVREPDGIHLNVSGAAIAAREIERVMRERQRPASMAIGSLPTGAPLPRARATSSSRFAR